MNGLISTCKWILYRLGMEKSRFGLALFGVYFFFYTGYVLLSAFEPTVMEQVSVVGVNVAILYGMALIAGAFLLALIYCWHRRDR